MTLTETIATISRLCSEVVTTLEKEKADFEAVQQDIQTQKEEIVRKGELLTKERRAILDQVEPMRKDREELALKTKTVEKLEAIERESIEKYDGLTALLESQKKQLDLDRDKQAKEQDLLEKQKVLLQKETEEFEITKARILKTEETLDFRQKSLELREEQIVVKEKRIERLYAST